MVTWRDRVRRCSRRSGGWRAVLQQARRPVTTEDSENELVVDTLRWATDREYTFCACDMCWIGKRFWRYAALVANYVARANPAGMREDLANGIWQLLDAPRWSRALWPKERRHLRRPVEILLRAAEKRHWNRAQLFEAVMRGISTHWVDPRTEPGFAPIHVDSRTRSRARSSSR